MTVTGVAVVSLCVGGVALGLLAFLWACGRAD